MAKSLFDSLYDAIMATLIWVDISLGNGLLPDETKPLPKPHQAITWTNTDLLSVRFCGIYVRTISQEMLKTFITSDKLHSRTAEVRMETKSLNLKLRENWRM